MFSRKTSATTLVRWINFNAKKQQKSFNDERENKNWVKIYENELNSLKHAEMWRSWVHCEWIINNRAFWMNVKWLLAVESLKSFIFFCWKAWSYLFINLPNVFLSLCDFFPRNRELKTTARRNIFIRNAMIISFIEEFWWYWAIFIQLWKEFDEICEKLQRLAKICNKKSS